LVPPAFPFSWIILLQRFL